MPSSLLSSKLSLVASALAFAVPASAAALPAYVANGTECTLSLAPGLSQAPALVDPFGYRFDTSENAPLLGQLLPAHYATLAEGSHPTVVPGRAVRDAYDDWGDLFVGSTQSAATQYLDGDPLGCSREASGREVDFARLTIGGLQVRRTLFVSAASGSGARLVQSVTNLGAAPVTTSVFVGDLRGAMKRGSLGSDDDTTIERTSSGDASLTGADRWAVTSDGGAGGDPSIAHVWDGPGGASRATIVRIGAQGGTKIFGGDATLPDDQLGYGWQNVSIPAGATASFLSWEAVRAAADHDDQNGLAFDAAESVSSAGPSTVYEGMEAAEIAAVRNWAKPAPKVAIAPVPPASAGADVTLGVSAVEFAEGALPQCDTGTLRWDFGDGATTVGSGGTHRFAAGPAEVTVTARNACGGVAEAKIVFEVAAAQPPSDPAGGGDDPVAPTPTPSPAPAADPPAAVSAPQPIPRPAPAPTPARVRLPFAINTPATVKASLLGKKGVVTAVVSTMPGALKVSLTGGGVKLSKSMTLVPGEPRTPTFKLGAKDLAKARRVGALQLQAVFTPAGGQQAVVDRVVAVRK